MRTSKPISTISYNTPEFLDSRCRELVRNHKISDFNYITHFPEDDETKTHTHVWLNPNTLLDTLDLQDFFKEFDPANPTKPLGCIDFRPSKIDDFILYGLHHEQYLLFKGESRKYHYDKSDFHFLDEDTFSDLYNHALKGSKFALDYQRLSMLNSGLSPYDLIASGVIPLNLACSVNSFVNLRDKTFRNGRSGHSVDPETGEIKD